MQHRSKDAAAYLHSIGLGHLEMLTIIWVRTYVRTTVSIAVK